MQATFFLFRHVFIFGLHSLGILRVYGLLKGRDLQFFTIRIW